MSKTTTWTSWDLSTVPRLSHSYPPARATFTFRDKAAWGRSVGTLLARSLGAVAFSSLQAHPPRAPQCFVSIRNRGSWSGAQTARTTPNRCGWRRRFPPSSPGRSCSASGKHLSSRAPKFSHPRRIGSSYLLSGLAKCKTCNTPLIGRFAQSGKYSYYVCQSNIKLGRDACETPTLNARRFEELVVNKIRSNILTEGNIRDLVKVVAEEMDGVTREQRKRLETIEDELEEVKRKLGRIWHFIETSDASDRIREHRERQERLEYFAEQAGAVLAQRRKVLDDVNTIAAYAKDMKDFLKESELTDRRAFIQSFIKEIVVVPGDALLRYTVPMPDDSSIPGRAAEKVALNGSVLSTLPDGGAGGTRTISSFSLSKHSQRFL